MRATSSARSRGFRLSFNYFGVCYRFKLTYWTGLLHNQSMENNTYTAQIETPGGLRTVTCTDQQINALGDSKTRLMRDQLREGVLVAPSEIAAQYAREYTTKKHIQCGNGQSIFEAVREQFGEEFLPVHVGGMGARHPLEPGMVGTVTVRPGESFAVVPRVRA